MKIQKISIENFRQFFDRQELSFSTSDTQNITVIHGENGSGKTSLLNAFKWCFYGTTDFDTEEKNILNENAIFQTEIGNSVKIIIEVEFEDDGKKYTARRIQEFTIVSNPKKPDCVGGTLFELDWITADGGFEQSNNPQNQFNKILPQEMHSYFLFNGERIEKLAYSSSSGEIRNAIRNLMGLEVMERGRDHLNGRVRKHFNEKMKVGAVGKLRDLIEQEGTLQEEIEDFESQLAQIKINIAGFDQVLEDSQNRLRSIKGVAALQKQRDNIQSQLSAIKEKITKNAKKTREIIGTRGFLSFLKEPAINVSKILEDRRMKGELPYAIKRQFIEDLLDGGECICGTKLLSGSTEFQSVEVYKGKASPDGIEEAFTRTSGALGQFEVTRVEFYNSLRDLMADRSSLSGEQDKLNGALDEISSKVSKSEIEDANLLEAKIKETSEFRDQDIEKRAKLGAQLEKMKEQLAAVQKDRKAQEEKAGHLALASKRHAIVVEASQVLGDLHEALAHQTRVKLSNRVNLTFKKILKKDYKAEIDKNFSLQVLKEIAGVGAQVVHEKSTGESQVTSLSFIASIVSHAHEKSIENTTFLKGGVFPIIMDSPFGALDPDYRTLVARYIPELAQQIILMCSKSQWDGEVQAECEKRVGKHLSLIYHAPKTREGLEAAYIRDGASYEHTLVEDGYNV